MDTKLRINTKEAEERDYIEKFQKYLMEVGETVEIIHCPIASDIQKSMNDGDSVSDALIKRNKEPWWVEIVTASRTDAERAEIGKIRNGVASPDNLVHIMNLDYAHLQTVDSISKAIRGKCDKDYTKFAHIMQASKGALIIGFICQDPFFEESEECARLLSCFDRVTDFGNLGCGKSNFDEIYLCAYVLKGNGLWNMKFYLIANSKMLDACRNHQKMRRAYGLEL